MNELKPCEKVVYNFVARAFRPKLGSFRVAASNISKAFRLVFWLLTPSRAYIRRLRRAGLTKTYRATVLWNACFQLFLLLVFVVSFIPVCPIIKKPLILMAAYISLSRIAELVIAYWSDAFDKIAPIKPQQIKGMTKRRRVQLLFVGYGELTIQFSTLYYAIDYLTGDINFMQRFNSVWDALYLSVITISTLGYGDLYPTNWLGRIAVGSESLCGILFIALSLSSYFSMKDDGIVS